MESVDCVMNDRTSPSRTVSTAQYNIIIIVGTACFVLYYWVVNSEFSLSGEFDKACAYGGEVGDLSTAIPVGPPGSSRTLLPPPKTLRFNNDVFTVLDLDVL